MSYTKVSYQAVEPVSDAMHFLREPLDLNQLGVTVVECPPGWSGKAHDHADRGHEEVYVLVEGDATVTVDGEPVTLEAGDAIRVAPDATRQLKNGDAESTFVIAGAP